jgi:hypothetical protein|nr:MAG TPA: hypothetical protein [Caudoviricetes sp.]
MKGWWNPMASSRVLPHVVTIFNYVGKDDDGKPKYQATLLSGVYFREHRAVNGISAPDDYAIAHIFDKGTIASDGRRFLDRYEWDDKLDHTGFWTLRDDGKDYIAEGDVRLFGIYASHAHRIVRVKRNLAGNKRMWGWKVAAQ